MSDNGIYVVKSKKGYRIGECVFMENIDFYIKNVKMGKRAVTQFLKDTFGKSSVYRTKEAAVLDAFDMMHDYETVVFGVRYAGDFSEFF